MAFLQNEVEAIINRLKEGFRTEGLNVYVKEFAGEIDDPDTFSDQGLTIRNGERHALVDVDEMIINDENSGYTQMVVATINIHCASYSTRDKGISSKRDALDTAYICNKYLKDFRPAECAKYLIVREITPTLKSMDLNIWTLQTFITLYV